MGPILRIFIGFTIAFLLHEFTHLLVIYHYNIHLKAIVFTKWGAFGFLVDNEDYINDNRKLVFLHFLPLIWCSVIFIDPSEPFFLMFPLVNIFGGLGDIYFFLRIIVLPVEKRLEITNRDEEKILKTIVWRKDIKSRTI